VRLRDIIAFGTERYPEKVARRLRAVNITAWLAALLPACFTIIRLLDAERWHWAIVNASFAIGLAAIPLLHRFGPQVGPMVLVVIGYAHLFRLDYEAGTGFGAHLGYLTAAALGMVAVGIERIRFAAVLAAAAAGLIILLRVIVPYDTGQMSSREVLVNFVINVSMSTVILFVVVFYALRQAARSEAVAEEERGRSDALLANILPASVAERLRSAPEEVIADHYDEASVLFADMEGFTSRAGAMSPDDLVRFLDRVFSAFDRLVEKHGVEKIKTSGDAYMVVAGVPERRPDHAKRLADFALDMRDAAARFGALGETVPIRIGMATGPVVAGVVGSKRFFYDVWGDAVNMASRMETTGKPGAIQVSAEAYQRLKDRFRFEPRGSVDIKGKGPVETWFLVGRAAAGDGAADQAAGEAARKSL
jgi:adenylate cyclase